MAGEKALKPLINMERETGFEPATLALARQFHGKALGPDFRSFFNSRHLSLSHRFDEIHENPHFRKTTGTNLAQSRRQP